MPPIPRRHDSSLLSSWRRARRWRTPLIALLSLAVLLWAAVWRWDVDPRELLGYLLAVVIGLVVIVAAALLASLLLRWWRER